MKRITIGLLASFILHMMVNAQQEIPLYTKVPNSKPAENLEKAVTGTDGITRISNVSVPTITVYRPVNAKRNSPAVIICPGGGYTILAASHEGADVAAALNEWGVTAFVLKYRLPDDRIMEDKSIGPLQDAERAVQWVREHAKEYQVDPRKVGIMGFSAGGHLAATLSTHYEERLVDNPEKISLRPDFSVLVYPVISFTDSLTHRGSRDRLLGAAPSAALIQRYSNELLVNKKTPPAFLVHAKDDKAVPWQNSQHYYEALRAHKVPARVFYYEKGGHGFGMNNKTSDLKWMTALKDWMNVQHLL
ncbi:alpha/beta hydrolase [Niabella drilacis]|uniref:Acetyl esterase/lipase n=1 Tax=Niabella drilacis (strain DSM 25811 / CCM 8410 / CCUG 62505 / LMG 26954 / E90) TaxID=1285928 RepID=A0A1G6J100_NIADE|nr:alpha/beta hydrolase [Niabella drilacis]SDC12494.1 Acetyl esterase/lipase [Niabella drilacis]